MEVNNLLEELENALIGAFESTDKNTKKEFDSFGRNALISYLCIKKNEKGLREVIENGAIAKNLLLQKHSSETINLAISRNYIRECQSKIKSNHFHITPKGLYSLHRADENLLEKMFEELDKTRLPELKIQLKAEEKILCLFLMIVGADSKEHAFILENDNLEKLAFEFLIKIDETINQKGFPLEKVITWRKGKKINFRKFVTENRDLPKTSLFYSVSSPNKGYYLDLNNRTSINYLLNLILDHFDEHDQKIKKLILYNILWDFSNRVYSDLKIMTPSLNDKLIQELRI